MATPEASPGQGDSREVATVEEALRLLGLPSDQRIVDLDAAGMAAFRQLIGWEPGGPVVSYPTPAERAARQRRESWKAERAGKGQSAPCLWLGAEEIERFKANAAADEETARWRERLIAIADGVAELPASTFADLIPDLGPWVFAGSFCPHCVGAGSAITQHAAFWRWSVLDPDHLSCPHCGITYPHPDYPEEGRLELPRLGLSYEFYLSPEERAADDWRDGRLASNFAGIPTHVSFSGEIRTCKLAWALGQVEPMAAAYAISGDERYARVAGAILARMSEVYPRYPVFSYGQEYIDADPAFAVERVAALPTPFRRAATLATYTGEYAGRRGARGMDRTTPAISHYTNAEWGTSRLGREKASNGQLSLSLLKGYDLVRQTIPGGDRLRIERDFLLELYLDTKGLSRTVNNKSGPGAASRVALGICCDDDAEIEEGLAQFREILSGQFYEDGSWKETPIYGAKSLFEGMVEIPEMLRGRVDLYRDALYRAAFQTYADLATPLGTQPALDDSPAEYRLQPQLVDMARIRLGLQVPYGPESMEGFGVRSPSDVGNNSGYAPSLECIPDDASRHFLDGPIGFAAMGHIPRRPSPPSYISMFGERRPVPANERDRPAVSRYYSGRGLVCLGYGGGREGVQLYCDGGDSGGGHRHQAPLALLLFAGGREVLPDLGYIADHPANSWIRATASHNTVVVDERSMQSATHCVLKALIGDGPFRFFDVATEVMAVGGDRDDRVRFRRATLLLPKPGGLPVLVDVFDVEGGGTHDYIMRANDPEGVCDLSGKELAERAPLYAEMGERGGGPSEFRTAGAAATVFTASWGRTHRLRAHVMTPCDEVITFKSPAWRNHMEVFSDPECSWEALTLRKAGGRSRFVVVSEVGEEDHHLREVLLDELYPQVRLTLTTGEGKMRVAIGDGTCEVKLP